MSLLCKKFSNTEPLHSFDVWKHEEKFSVHTHLICNIVTFEIPKYVNLKIGRLNLDAYMF